MFRNNLLSQYKHPYVVRSRSEIEKSENKWKTHKNEKPLHPFKINSDRMRHHSILFQRIKLDLFTLRLVLVLPSSKPNNIIRNKQLSAAQRLMLTWNQQITIFSTRRFRFTPFLKRIFTRWSHRERYMYKK